MCCWLARPACHRFLLRSLLGQVNVRLPQMSDRFKYKQEYEEFKMWVTYLIILSSSIIVAYSHYSERYVEACCGGFGGGSRVGACAGACWWPACACAGAGCPVPRWLGVAANTARSGFPVWGWSPTLCRNALLSVMESMFHFILVWFYFTIR